MTRKTAFSPGQRWQVRRNEKPSQDFDFVILGPGSKSNRKLCRVEYVRPGWGQQNFEAEYSREHIKECATLVQEDI